MKLYVLPANEDWIVDQMADDVHFQFRGMTVRRPGEAEILWLLADWRWKEVIDLRNPPQNKGQKVVTTVHHIVPEKFDTAARLDFYKRDSITDYYHVFNQRTFDFIRPLTNKSIILIPYWCNQWRWKKSNLSKLELRKKYQLPINAHILMSAQRDTEGAGIEQGIFLPKSEKGPEKLASTMIEMFRRDSNVHILLGGWRRQYLIKRLKEAQVPYSYFERPPQETLNELYQCADTYLVTSVTEGGPQSLLECGLLDIPVVSTPVGIAEQVLPPEAINDNVLLATPTIPNVDKMKLTHGMAPYLNFFKNIK